MVGIVGPNGAGKTSLFSLISGDLEPDSGQIRLGGAVITRQSAAARCRLGIGRTYQVPRPFGAMTVFENVLVAVQQGGGLRRRASYARAAAVLEPDRAGRRGEQPGRAARACSSASGWSWPGRWPPSPRLLLLDEVAGGLTDPEVAQLVEIVLAIRDEGVAIIWIEHVVRALTAAVGRLLCLAGGVVRRATAPRPRCWRCPPCARCSSAPW